MENHKKGPFPSHPKIIFMGTPDFAVPALETLVSGDHAVLSVITQPDRPKGRGRKLVPTPVKLAATRLGIEVLQPEKASGENFCELIRRMAPDLLIVVAFGQILKNNLLEIPRWGALNIHASLLPEYRGAAPIHWAILDNRTKTGLTAMRLDQGLDTGPILLQEEVSIYPEETAGQLHDRLSDLSGEFLMKTLKGMAEGRLKERPQDHARATYATKIDRRMARINWEEPAEVISALIRALDPWPGAFTTLAGKEIKLFSSGLGKKDHHGSIPGRVTGHEKGALRVETGKGLVKIRELQIQGKKRLPADDFLRGFPLEQGSVLGG